MRPFPLKIKNKRKEPAAKKSNIDYGRKSSQ